MATDERADSILKYWFGDDYSTQSKVAFDTTLSKKWFMGGAHIDEEIKAKFTHLLPVMASGELDAWLQHSYDALAGVILMDQFTRNSYRGDKKTFAWDPQALRWAKELVDTGRCASFPLIQQFFLILPFMHSEVLQDQERCVELAKGLHAQADAELKAGNAAVAPLVENLQGVIGFAEAHRDVVAKWGRFPHRNAVLGRESTAEEVAGLADGSIRRFG